jgi:serine/threonine protein kinase
MDLQRIGRYDIKSMIGQGGMSTVYLGYDPRSQREVAIKVLPPYYLHSTKFRERFEREALMIALLEHPAIVPVYDMGEEEGQPYIVMRYMSGGSLSGKLKKGPIPLRECMEMYLRLAPALDTAHARGVTHRDVKPDNLLFDKYDNVFLSDFGLARLRETIGFANISDGSIMGTPAYMSPEQIQGDHAIDGRSDIYSMGVVLYQMLCGSVPFSGTTAASVMMMHLVNPIPQILDANKTLPLGIQAVLDKAMSKKPDDRYQSAGEFARAIQAVTTGVQRRPSTRPISVPVNGHVRTSLPSEFTDEGSSVSPDHPSRTGSNPNLPNGSSTPPTALPVEQQNRVVATQQAGKQPSEHRSGSLSSRPVPLLKQRYILPVWGWLVSAVVLMVLSLLVILWTQGIFPFSPSPGSPVNTGNPSALNTSVSQAVETAVLTGQSSLVLGHADKLAFISASEIWSSNLDGSEPTQLTDDGLDKSNLQWTPDGQSVIYNSGSCIKLVGSQTRETHTVTCFEGIPSISAFSISPDGQQLALALGDADLYLFPFTQLFTLQPHSHPADLGPLVQCAYFAPYHTTEAIKAASWSLVADQLALLLSNPVDGSSREQVSIYDFSQCTASPPLVQEISPTYFLFNLRGYYQHPEISGLTWNKDGQFLFNGSVSSSGFGDFQLYNLDNGQTEALAPNGSCCYRDVRWSPDGSYIFYSYQPEAGGDISLFYVPSSQLNQPGEAMAALALPPDLLDANQGALQPALRTAH